MFLNYMQSTLHENSCLQKHASLFWHLSICGIKQLILPSSGDMMFNYSIFQLFIQNEIFLFRQKFS